MKRLLFNHFLGWAGVGVIRSPIWCQNLLLEFGQNLVPELGARIWCQNLVPEFGARVWQFCELPGLLNSSYETATFRSFSGLGWGGGYQKPIIRAKFQNLRLGSY